MKTKNTAWMLAGLFALGALAGPGLDAKSKGHDHGSHAHGSAEGEKVTLTGEVLDLACYMAHEGMGKKHMKCAKACLEGTAPAGLLTGDGKVYLLVEDHGQKKPMKQARELGGERATISGKMYVRGGLPGIVVHKVEKPKK